MKVFITRDIPDIGFELLKKARINFEWHKKDSPISRRQLLIKVKECDGLICLLTEKIDKEVIAAAKELKN